MRYLISAALLALTLTACGGGDSETSATDEPSTTQPTSESTTTTEPAAPTTSAEPEGESTECLLSATKFADRAGAHALSFATTAPAFGEQEELSDLDDLLSEVSVLCSAPVNSQAIDIMVPLTRANYEVALCALDFDDFGGCQPAANRKVHKIGERAAGMVGDLRNLLKG